MAHRIGVQGPSKLVKKHKTPPLCEPLPGEPLTQIKKFFFNRTKNTCRIRRGFEQLSSYSGWRVVTKKPCAILLARAVVKGRSLKVVKRTESLVLTTSPGLLRPFNSFLILLNLEKDLSPEQLVTIKLRNKASCVCIN